MSNNQYDPIWRLIEYNKLPPYQDRLNDMLKLALENDELDKLFLSDSKYYVYRFEKELVVDRNDIYKIMILLFDTDEKYDVQNLIINVIKKLMISEDINNGLYTIATIVSSYYQIKEEYVNATSPLVFIDSELRKSRINNKNVDFSEINNLFIKKIIENKESLMSDQRLKGQWDGLWEAISWRIKKLVEKYNILLPNS
jgi:hypothetical protein